MSGLREGQQLKKFFENYLKDTQDKYKFLIEWSEEDKQEFRKLLEDLEKPYDKNVETKREKGNRLERVVKFIIEHTFFYEVYQDIRTDTNEIDEICVLSDKGRQALHSFGIARDIIPLEDLFIGECKNYDSALSVTYVGKFYSLMKSIGMPVGILFTQKGITGQKDEYRDAHELIKMLKIVEKATNNKDIYIIVFTKEDYQKLLEGHSFFEIVKAKKLELDFSADYNKFLKDNKHNAEKEIIEVISKVT